MVLQELWVVEVLFYTNLIKVPLEERLFLGIGFLQEVKEPSALTKNSCSWIGPVLTELRADPGKAPNVLFKVFTHTHGGQRAVLCWAVVRKNW